MNDSKAIRAEELFRQLQQAATQVSKQQELAQRQIISIRGDLFQQQLDIADDPHQFKAALCNRRAGKTTGAIRYMLLHALTTPRANILFITLSASKARKEIWPSLKRDVARYEISAHPNEVLLEIHFDNQAVIHLGGADSIQDTEKFRGSDGGYTLIIVDECGSYPEPLLDYLITQVLQPTLTDRNGTLLLLGTPGRTLSGQFYSITGPGAYRHDHDEDARPKTLSRPYVSRQDKNWKDVAYSWSTHRWSSRDNVAMPQIWENQIAMKVRNAWTDEDPRWRREYLAEWVSDDSVYVFRYDPERNDWQGELPEGHDWHYVLGCDLGYDDDFAIVVAAYSDTCPTLYVVDELSLPKLDIAQQAEKLKHFQSLYNIESMVGDRGGLGKAIFATLSNQYGLDIRAADKHEKRDYIELLNSDLLSGRLKVRRNSQLSSQLSSLQWKSDGKTIDKSDKRPDHLADACLYLWRFSRHHLYKRTEELRDTEAADYIRATATKLRDRLGKEAERKSKLDYEDRYLERKGFSKWEV